MLQTKATLSDALASHSIDRDKPIVVRINGSDPMSLDITSVDNKADALELHVTINREAAKVPLSFSQSMNTLTVLSGPAGHGQDEAVYLSRLDRKGALNSSEVIFMTPDEAVRVALDLLGSAMKTKTATRMICRNTA